MNNRRGFLTAASAFAAYGLCGCASHSSPSATSASASTGGDMCMAYDKTRQSATTPDKALALLKEGNARFVAGKSTQCDLRAQVKATADGQAPIAAIVGCIDSRVPPEMVFDQQIGSLFAARIAGNFVNTDIMGSLEFATQLAGAKLIVVLGHTECGAIKGAVDDAKLGNLTAMLANIRPAVSMVKGVEGPQTSKNKKLVQAVADQNVKDAAAMLFSRSAVLRDQVTAGKLKIVTAMHDVGTGQITWMA